MKRARTLLVTALAAGALALAAWTRALSARAERDFPPEGRFVEVEGRRLHVVERGSGPPIVLVHGAFGGTQDWTATGIVDELARTHRVLAFDRPGHGWSERADTGEITPLGQARVLRAACAQLGVERPIVVGFSWGGALALAWALAWPDELAGICVVNGVAYPWPGPTSTPYVLAGLPIVGPFMAHVLAGPLGALQADAAVARAFAPAPVPASFDRSPIPLALRPAQFLVEAEDMRLLKPAVALQSLRHGEIRVPLEILAGRGDLVAHWDWHAAQLQRAVPGSELTVVDGAGHQMLHSHPRAVVEAVERLAARTGAR